MADVSISLNNIRNIKTRKIKGLGEIRVRRLGVGEDLDLSIKMRRLYKVLDELEKIDFSGLDATKPDDLKEIQKLSKKAEALSDEVAEIKQFEFDTYKRCLSDDKNGEIVDIIMNTLTEMERAELLRQIFEEKKEIVAPETITPAVENEAKND